MCYYYLEAVEVHRLEVVRGASTPIDNVLVLALAAQFAVPVGDAQVVIHHALAVGAVLQHRVEERLLRNRNRDRETKLENCVHYSLSHHLIHREEIELNFPQRSFSSHPNFVYGWKVSLYISSSQRCEKNSVYSFCR